jgi:hypothetical protein
MSNQNKKNESKAPDEKVAENKNIDDMKNGSIALLKDTKELIKATSSSEEVLIALSVPQYELHRNTVLGRAVSQNAGRTFR